MYLELKTNLCESFLVIYSIKTFFVTYSQALANDWVSSVKTNSSISEVLSSNTSVIWVNVIKVSGWAAIMKVKYGNVCISLSHIMAINLTLIYFKLLNWSEHFFYFCMKGLTPNDGVLSWRQLNSMVLSYLLGCHKIIWWWLPYVLYVANLFEKNL